MELALQPVALYARVATERQVKEGTRLVNQIVSLKEWAAEHEYAVVQVFRETGPGWGDHREIFRKMIEIACSSEHPFEAILVQTPSRFSRDIHQRELKKRELAKHGVQVIFTSQAFPDCENPAYLLENQLGLMDEFQRCLNSERVMHSLRENAQKGFFNGSIPPFGYVALPTDVRGRNGYKKKLQIHHADAQLVRRIFDLAEFGESGTILEIKRIMQRLNSDGELYHGRKWTAGQIERILKNCVYIGEHITFRRDSRKQRERPPSEWVRASIPAILSDLGQFDRVQARLASCLLENK